MTEPMSQNLWHSRGALAGQGSATTLSVRSGPGVTLTEHAPVLIYHVLARRGAAADVRRVIGGVIGCDVPAEARIAIGTAGSVVWSGPGQWLVMAGPNSAITRTLPDALAAIAAVIDQSGSRLIVRLSGQDVRRCLGKVMGLDLHPAVFAVGHVAMTDLAHVPVHVWRSVDGDGQAVFYLAAPRSYAGSVWHALVAAAAEYGLDARPLE